ncbi:MAG: glycine--tRNA ligase subunit beta, partial [Rhodospirillales bacterium]
LPDEVLATAMRHHQKYFALLDRRGRLAPRFVVVLDTETRDRGRAAVAGNERVLRARLADAKFFWDQDRKATLESRLGALQGRVFHAKLGSVYDKVLRMEELASELAEDCGANTGDARWAARLAKADLSTEMVVEFPELQGVMGRYYALNDGEKPEVADAVTEHYAPQGPADACPSKPVSVAVALADKIDTLIGFWSIGEKPTGSKDPFALRRAALGVIRLILENRLTFSVRMVIETGWTSYPNGDDINKLHEFQEDLRAFLFDRLKVHLRDKGVRHDLIDALFASGGEDDLLRITQKAEALGGFLKTDDGANLLVAYRRANNIVRIEQEKDGEDYSGRVDENLFSQNEERELWTSLNDVEQTNPSHPNMNQFGEALTALARLRNPVDRFFDEVTVNCGDQDLRKNRLHMLSEITACLNRVADFSQIEGGER